MRALWPLQRAVGRLAPDGDCALRLWRAVLALMGAAERRGRNQCLQHVRSAQMSGISVWKFRNFSCELRVSFVYLDISVYDDILSSIALLSAEPERSLAGDFDLYGLPWSLRPQSGRNIRLAAPGYPKPAELCGHLQQHEYYRSVGYREAFVRSRDRFVRKFERIFRVYSVHTPVTSLINLPFSVCDELLRENER